MGPVGHLGIPLPVSRLFKLNMVVTGLCALLPDLIDKPLWALGIVCYGRYAAHTLLFVFLVAIAFSFRKRGYGLSALLGGMSHLLLDAVGGGFVPWFYPFVKYNFPQQEFSKAWLSLSSIFSDTGKELLWVISISGAVLLIMWLTAWLRRRSKRRVFHASQSNKTADRDEKE